MFLVHGFLVGLLVLKVSAGSVIEGLQTVPPSVSYGVNQEAFDKNVVASEKSLWTSETDDDDFIWEKSGLYEGDIMYFNGGSKNGLTDESHRWKNATIPFYIEEDHFSDEEIKTILTGIQEFHKKTCLRLRPYKKSDDNWLFITGDARGCWSYVGMKNEGGQQLNVNSPKCVRKGVVMHELLHAAGFYHQQSASNRDEFVKIIWDNISDGHESNFDKYNESYVSSYGTTYDYSSIMHYSGKAFSKNGNATIVSLQNVTELGQRDGFTDDDVIKLNRMYESSCHKLEDENQSQFINIVEWFRSLLNY